MNIQLKHLFPIGIFASLGAPIFLGISAVISNLMNDRAINIASIMTYMLAVWGFSIVFTEAVVLFIILIAKMFKRDEINVLLIGGMCIGFGLTWLIIQKGFSHLIENWFVIAATMPNFLFFFLISVKLRKVKLKN